MRVVRRLSFVVVAVALSLLGVAVPASAATHISVSPSTNLVDGQIVHVVVSGMPASSFFGVYQCMPGATKFTQCDNRTIVQAQTGPGGGANVPFVVSRKILVRVPKPGTPIDCRTAGCKIGIGSPFGGPLKAGGPITFNKTAPLAPGLTIGVTIDATGSVDTTTHIATVGGNFTCNRGSVFYVNGTVEQLIPFFGVWAVSRSYFTIGPKTCGDGSNSVPWSASVGTLDDANQGSFIVGFVPGAAKVSGFADGSAGGGHQFVQVLPKNVTLSASP